MPEDTNYDPNSKTLVIETKDFSFEPVTQKNGVVTVVRFRLENPHIKPGDVLLVLTGADVHFHGLIGRIEDGWGTATDQRSFLLAPIVN